MNTKELYDAHGHDAPPRVAVATDGPPEAGRPCRPEGPGAVGHEGGWGRRGRLGEGRSGDS
jgi:hypothetical protein